MDELYVCILSVGTAAFVLLFPIAADLNFHLDAAERKLYFGILLYRNIRLFGGYMEPRREGIAVHLSRKKAILFPTSFSMPAVKKVSDDPFEQAAYAYSLIESEVDGDGTK